MYLLLIYYKTWAKTIKISGIMMFEVLYATKKRALATSSPEKFAVV